MKFKKYSLFVVITFTIILGGCSANKKINFKNDLSDQMLTPDKIGGELETIADQEGDNNQAIETTEAATNPSLKQLTYKDNYIVYLEEECLSHNKGIEPICFFSIKIKEVEKGWEALIVNKNYNQMSLKWIKEDTLEYIENDGSFNINKSVNLNNIVKNVGKRLYTLNQQFSDIDLASIRILNYYYIKDKNIVYFEREKMDAPFIQVKDVDVTSFEVIPGFSSLAKDSNFVYFNGDKIDFSSKNFEFINPKYFKNNIGVGYLGYNGGNDYYVKIINTIDLKTVSVVNNDLNDYIKDANHVYYQGKIIESADPKTFKCLSPTHCKDSDNVYYWGTIIEGADPDTFKVIDVYYGYDKNNKYFEEKIVE